MSEEDKVSMKPRVIFANPRMPVLTPFQIASIEIGRLSQDPELIYNAVFGRPRNEEDRAEEARRNKLYLERFVTIVKRHGVEVEYLKPLIAKRNKLWSELAQLCAEIEAIRS